MPPAVVEPPVPATPPVPPEPPLFVVEVVVAGPGPLIELVVDALAPPLPVALLVELVAVLDVPPVPPDPWKLPPWSSGPQFAIAKQIAAPSSVRAPMIAPEPYGLMPPRPVINQRPSRHRRKIDSADARACRGHWTFFGDGSHFCDTGRR
jgi:hypothetical protein